MTAEKKKPFDTLFGKKGAERRISVLAAAILVLTVLVTGGVFFAVLAQQLRSELESSLVRTLNDRAALFHHEIDTGAAIAAGIASRRPHLAKLMTSLHADSADKEIRSEIGMVLDNIRLDQKLSAVALHDMRGTLVASSGEFLRAPFAVKLNHPENASLLWRDGYFLGITATMRLNDKTDGTAIGALKLEYPLAAMTRAFVDYRGLGETGELALCAALSAEQMRCFPTRHRPQPFDTARAVKGAPTPLSEALNSKTGVITTLDYREHEVLDAFQPAGDSGLGMVVKIDTDELMQPIRRHFLWIAPFLAVLLALGFALLRWQVGKPVREVESARMRLRGILDNSADGIITIDDHGIVESFNFAAARIFGYPAFEVIGKNVSMLMPEPYRLSHDKGIRDYLRSGEARVIGHGAREVLGQRKNGSIFPMDLTLGEMTLNGKRLFIGSVRDTSELKQAHDKLESSFNALQASTRDLEETQAQLRQAEQDNDRQMNALADANVRMVLYHASMERVREADAALSKGGEIEAFCHDTVNNAMGLTGARYGALGLFGADGKLVRFITEGIDAESRARIGKLPIGNGLLGALYREGKIERVDDIGADPRACGFPPNHPPMKSLIGVPICTASTTHGVLYLVDKDNGEPFTDNDEILMDMLGMEIGLILQRHELLEDLRVTNQALQTEREEQRVLIAKLAEAQNQLLQSEKMASIGQLAAGVAHEINNPIGYVNSNLGSLDNYIQSIFGVVAAYEQAENSITDSAALSNVQAAKREADLEFLRGDIAALMAESLEGISRVKKIVQDLKDFSHVDEAEWQWTDLHGGIDATLNIVWNELKYKAEVIKEYGNLPEIECYPSQINQVFMNLLVNAGHAIEEHGTITIRTGAEGEQVWVEITDSGKGIAPENLTRIFDPFFTTKPVGKGTGLGLSLSYGIVEKHRGRLEVESEIGKGTTFRVWLPIKHVDA